ncbi:C-type lectin lectoxin-Thr1-like [Pelodiscus sinensis]|uniref:C-type lectin lectoxin-Thr1-like n=1 Tax=Pelodiscus sinensis TaxID=13735 RepID=UPI003F6B55B3
MGPVAFFSLCLLGCLIFNPSLEAASPRRERSLRPGSGIKATGCLNGWLHYRDHCLKFFPEQVTWSAAEVQCQQHQPGAHLASIVNEAERDIVVEYLSISGSKDYVWIGLHDPNKDRTWVWTDGSLFGYSAWKPGEPHNLNNNEFCVELLVTTGYKNWNDVSCTSKNAYVCKYRL